jgi:dihydroxy-acid dehydratase
MAVQGLANNLTEYGDKEFALYLRRSFAKAMGFSDQALAKPIVGIVNTYSELNNCHRHFPQLVDAVKRGVWQAGGLPLEFPTISLGEVFLSPTSMLYRNLMSMDVESMIRAQPLDAVVLTGGCDKTLPALLMGAASAGLPAIVEVAGPMLTSQYEGERLGACTDCRRFWARFRRGEIDREQINAVEGQLAPTPGTCSVMGTASTMACLVEALGMMLPGGAAIPAVYADRMRHAEETGREAVRLAAEGLTPAQIMTPRAFDNALRVLQAIGGSTNAIIHLTAIAGRLGIALDLQRVDELAATTPVLVDLKPTGKGYMEDFHRAGGMHVLLQELRHLLHLDQRTVDGRTWQQVLDEPYSFPSWQGVIHPFAQPLQPEGALVVLRGNLAPDGAIIKRGAATPSLLETRGRAVVFTSLEDMAARIDSPDLDVTPADVLVLQNAGPLGGPGMPEAGYLPIPKKLAAAGVTDMVRISDARMSGTAFGTVVLHVSPEAAAGGPLGLVRDGDIVELSVARREITLHVDAEELQRRRGAMVPRPPAFTRGYEGLYLRHCQQAHLGADLDFLRPPPFN